MTWSRFRGLPYPTVDDINPAWPDKYYTTRIPRVLVYLVSHAGFLYHQEYVLHGGLVLTSKINSPFQTGLYNAEDAGMSLAISEAPVYHVQPLWLVSSFIRLEPCGCYHRRNISATLSVKVYTGMTREKEARLQEARWLLLPTHTTLRPC